MKHVWLLIFHFLYKHLLRRILFLWSSETIHDALTFVGKTIGSYALTRNVTIWLFQVRSKKLQQSYYNIVFPNPVGLAAGFDYNGQLYNILPSLGFGFGTIGTITNKPYKGNPKPRLGRLIRSRSLMVNKGFKNIGITALLQKIKGHTFHYPVGISIGQTNSPELSHLENAIDDIYHAFRMVEDSSVPFSYYELNISCPNLQTNVSFYSEKNLTALLTMIKRLKLSRPVFVKMPIEKSDEEVINMLDIIQQFPIQGVIFGNLQKNRQDSSLVQEEVVTYPKGNFSGKPTEKRSNELISLAYKHTKGKLLIIGCGGIFSAKDAYKKIKLGASLVQFITGMIYEGPQLAAQINLGLLELLKRDGYKNITEAVGKKVE